MMQKALFLEIKKENEIFVENTNNTVSHIVFEDSKIEPTTHLGSKLKFIIKPKKLGYSIIEVYNKDNKKINEQITNCVVSKPENIWRMM